MKLLPEKIVEGKIESAEIIMVINKLIDYLKSKEEIDLSGKQFEQEIISIAKDVKEKVNKVKELIEPADKPKKWKPEEGEEYYIVSFDGDVYWRNYNERSTDDMSIIEFGNYFKTKQEAREMATKIKELLNK